MRIGFPEYADHNHKTTAHKNLLAKVKSSKVEDITIHKNPVNKVYPNYVTWNVIIYFYKKQTLVKYPFFYVDRDFIIRLWAMFKDSRFAVEIFKHTYCEEYGEHTGS